MPLPAPRLDDRSFAAMVQDALAVAGRACPDWTDRSAGDPGVTLLELFAFLTESLLYRVNRAPEKLRVELMNLLGVKRRPPSAAAATLTFTRTTATGEVELRAGTRITTADGATAFILAHGVRLAADATAVEAPALNCDLVEAERLGFGDGAPGQEFQVRRPPIVASTGDGLDLIVGVEAEPDDIRVAHAPSRSADGKAYRIWREVETFGECGPGDCVYTVDRMEGRLRFGSGPLGRRPPRGAEVRAWYRRGGGVGGNVVAGALTMIKGGPPGIAVTNAARAAGGADAESVEQAVQRTPMEAAAIRTAVTARDYERLATEVGGVARARAYAQADAWRHAAPGVVDVLLVPAVEPEAAPNGAVTAAAIVELRGEHVRAQVQAALDAKRMLGSRVAVGWAKVRPVSVRAKVVVSREEDPAAVKLRLERGLNRLFSPLRRDAAFGRSLKGSDVYEVLLAEPGVRYASDVRLVIGEAPNANVRDLTRDPHQPKTWFAATAAALHRTLDDGDSWSTVFLRAGEQPVFLRRHPERPGLAALGVLRGKAAAVHVSADCGETWREAAVFDSVIWDAAWIPGGTEPTVIVATDHGLRRFRVDEATAPTPVAADPEIDARGYYAVTARASGSGVVWVAAAAKMLGGVHVSAAGGASGTFRLAGLAKKDVRNLLIDTAGGREMLWGGAEAEAGQPGEGAFRLELAAGAQGGAFAPFNVGWQGGSCEALAVVGDILFAGSNRGGVLRLDTAAAEPAWSPGPINGGLPRREDGRPLEVVTSLAAASTPEGRPLVFAGGPLGVYRSDDGARQFAESSAVSFKERAPLPANWLYCAAAHELAVVSEDEDGAGD
jgi:hypothetical protein